MLRLQTLPHALISAASLHSVAMVTVNPLTSSVCLSLRQQQPPGPQDILAPQLPSHIEHNPSPSQFFFYFFFVCFILLRPEDRPAALWLHLLSHLLQRYGACTAKRDRHALFLIYLTASDIGSVSPCALHMQGRLPKECKRKFYAASLQGQISGSVSKALPGVVIT